MPPGAAAAADGSCYWPDCLSALRHRACQDCPQQHLSFLPVLGNGVLGYHYFSSICSFVRWGVAMIHGGRYLSIHYGALFHLENRGAKDHRRGGKRKREPYNKFQNRKLLKKCHRDSGGEQHKLPGDCVSCFITFALRGGEQSLYSRSR